MASFTFIFANNATEAKKTDTGSLHWTLSLWVLFHLLFFILILYLLPCLMVPLLSPCTPNHCSLSSIKCKRLLYGHSAFLWPSSLSGLVKPQPLSLAFLWFPGDAMLSLPGFQTICWETSFLLIQKSPAHLQILLTLAWTASSTQPSPTCNWTDL